MTAITISVARCTISRSFLVLCLVFTTVPINAAAVKQATTGDCSPALAFVSGNVEIRCELRTGELKQLASAVAKFQQQSKARAFETERLVKQINGMLASVSAAQTELFGRVEGQHVQIAQLTKLISTQLKATSGKTKLALEQTRAWPGEFDRLRLEWRAGDMPDSFADAYDSFVLGNLDRTADLLSEHIRHATAGKSAVARAHYLYARIKELQFEPTLAFESFEKAWKLAPSNLDYRLHYAHGLRQRRNYAQAAEQYRTALEALRPLARSPGGRYRALLAETLMSLARVHSELEQEVQAERAYAQARDIFEKLSQGNPEAFEPAFAISLSELGLIYGDARRYREAEMALSAADSAYRRLTLVDYWQYEPELVANLIDLARLHMRLERDVEADADLREAEQRARLLADKDGVGFGRLLAAVMYLRGTWWGMGHENAIDAFRSAKDALEQSVEADRHAYEADYAEVLHALGRAQWNAVGLDRSGPRVEGALHHLRQARDVYARLALTNPAVFEPKLVRTLRDLGHVSFFTRDYEDGDAALQEARRRVAAKPELNGDLLNRIEEEIEDLHRLWEHDRKKNK